MYDFDGMVVLITGAGRKRGFGRATALRFAERGADVVLGSVCHPPKSSPENKEAGWEELLSIAAEVEALGRSVLPVQVDVSCEEAVRSMVASAMERFARIDILVNNAGLNTGMKPVVEVPEWEWDLTFDVMAKGTFLCCKHVVPNMVTRGAGGKIINLSSQAGKSGQPNEAPYAAAKAAIISLTQSLSRELARYRINVNAICPGLVDTDINAPAFETYARLSRRNLTPEETRQAVMSRIPLGRFGTVEEVADLIVFLASEQASYMTGQAINLTGGQTMH